MEDFFPQLLTVGIGLGVLGTAYLVDLIAKLANVFDSANSEAFSFKALGRGLAKTLIWAVAVFGFTTVMNLLNWFTLRLGTDISGLLGDANTVGVLGIIVVASGTFLKNAYDNINEFINHGNAAPKLDMTPDYKQIAADFKEFADKITPKWTQTDEQTDSGAEKEAAKEQEEVGLGASVNPLSRRLPDGDNDAGKGWQAHRLGTLINLYGGGYKKVEDLEVGDELISDAGEKAKVVRAWSAHHPMYEIKTTQGKFYYTPEHPLLVKHSTLPQSQIENRHYTEDCFDTRYIKVQDLQIGDRLVPNYITEDKPQTGLSDEDLTILGFWLGDGYVDMAQKYTPKYCVVVNDAKKAFLDGVTDKITWSKHSNGTAWLGYIRRGAGVEDNPNSAKTSPLHDYLQRCGRYSYGKQVPFAMSIHEREKVLEGYLAADGSERQNGSGYVIATTSEALARWVQETAWALGKNSTVAKVREAGYQTNLGECKHALWNVSVSKDSFDRHNAGSFKVTGIEYLGDEDTIHIEVDGNHTYVAENIKVHNCSKYSYYLATGIRMNYAPHPDYGPCNGVDMVNYLCNNCGFVRCGKQNGAIFAYATGAYGHTGTVVDAANNIVNDANWNPLTVGTHYINLDAVGAEYCCPADMVQPEPTPEPVPEPAPAPEPSHDDAGKFKVGDWVEVTNPVDIYGTALATSGAYEVMEVSDNSVVIGRGGVITARVWAENLTKTSAPKKKDEIKAGDTVVPTRLIDYYGTPLYQWDPVYTVTEIDGDRAVLSARGQIWAAMNVNDIQKA